MLSTRMIIDHLMLSMNSNRGVLRAPVTARIASSTMMSSISRHRYHGRQLLQRLESRNIRKRQLAGMHMHAAEFGAAVQRREHLAGVEQALRIEGAFQPLLLV